MPKTCARSWAQGKRRSDETWVLEGLASLGCHPQLAAKNRLVGDRTEFRATVRVQRCDFFVPISGTPFSFCADNGWTCLDRAYTVGDRSLRQMRKPRFALLCFVLLAFGVSLAAPAKDLPDPVYDQSATSACVTSAPFSRVQSQAVDRKARDVRKVVDLVSGALSSFLFMQIKNSDGASPELRNTLALFCVFRC